MNEPKVTDLDYINFLVASPTVFSCTEAGRVQPASPRRAAHDAFTRLLQRLEPNATPVLPVDGGLTAGSYRLARDQLEGR